jgi:sugar phosphate isomerase/epimerase
MPRKSRREEDLAVVPGYLAVQLHHWHSGQGDPIYAVGSSAGTPVPRDLIEDARDNLQRILEDYDNEDADEEELVGLIDELDEVLASPHGNPCKKNDPERSLEEHAADSLRAMKSVLDHAEAEGAEDIATHAAALAHLIQSFVDMLQDSTCEECGMLIGPDHEKYCGA